MGVARHENQRAQQAGGTVTAIDKGTVKSTIQIDLVGGTMVTAMVTNASDEDLSLDIGKTAYAIGKASDVIVGAD